MESKTKSKYIFLIHLYNVDKKSKYIFENIFENIDYSL